MTRESLPPIFSNLGDRPELQEAVDRFVIGLAEAIDRIQDAEAASDLEQVAARCRVLAEEAQSHGYRGLADLSEAAAQASDQDKPELVVGHLRHMTQISCRVRRGHRGSS